jgi:methylglutaconyl-CoA hydratase
VLPRLLPRAAAELFLTGDTFNGAHAAQVGLVTTAVPEEKLDATVDRYVASLVRGAPAALAATKELLRATRDARPITDQLADLSAVSVRFFASAEGREGVAAFAEKRNPSWMP